MRVREYCSFKRSYSALEGLQEEHTLLYTASAWKQGVVMGLELHQRESVRRSAVLCTDVSFGRVMDILRYLSENSVGLESWLDVLDDIGQAYIPLSESQLECIEPEILGKSGVFCGI
ncbi:MAG: hypothetical protein ACI4JC_03360 [Faecalibacterium sp.]